MASIDPAPRTPDPAPYLFGFVGVVAAFFLLPRTLKFLIRRFVFGVISEVVLVVLAGLLTEKAVERLSQD